MSIRIFIDPGSQLSFITEQVVNKIGLQRETSTGRAIDGIGSTKTGSRGTVRVHISSVLHPTQHWFLRAHVMPSITSDLPSAHIDTNRWPHIRGLQLADPEFGTPGLIDMLIGAELWGCLAIGRMIHGHQNEPYAQETHLGYVVFGPTSDANVEASVRVCSATVPGNGATLEEIVQRFWHVEEVPDFIRHPDPLEPFFRRTHYRDHDGRYVVNIPFKSTETTLGDSYQLALRQFRHLERRLASNHELRDKYIEFMREYEQLGHMVRIDDFGDGPNRYYIPHHAVTEKFRVVFNASAKTTTGVSLNDIQHPGPTIQDPLINIILRFRQLRVALTADIEKMFRQILVTPNQRDFQRIIWRESPDEPLHVYQLTTVTYGMACSPYNAVRALRQCAYDNSHLVGMEQRWETEHILLTSFYVDDFLTSCNDVAAALALATAARTVLSAGNSFTLRKWNSNSTKVMMYIHGEQTAPAEQHLESQTTTVLGLHWDPAADQLFYRLTLGPPAEQLSRRIVLSEVARLFDPTGLLAPIVITGKVFTQRLWLTNLSWDTPIPDDLRNEWLTFRHGLGQVGDLRIDRWLGMVTEQVTTLHGFCDASSKAYAAVVYAKTTDEKGRTRVSLVTARTRVAPLQGATIPRLELSAAKLLTDTMAYAQSALGIVDTPCRYWSDSRIVLCWLQKTPTALKPYVANRVAHIQSNTDITRWHHVRSQQNPADCASRGISVPELCNHKLWWHGPKWLTDGPSPLDSDIIRLSESEQTQAEREEKAKVLSVRRPLPLTILSSVGIIPITERFSSMRTLCHVVAYVMRATPARRHWRVSSIVTPDQLEAARLLLIRHEQQQAFRVEIEHIKQRLTLPLNSQLIGLNPYIDSDGVLRMCSRLTGAKLSDDCRCPIILPKDGAFIALLLKEAHLNTLHGGTQLMLHTLRQRYWIVGGRRAVRSIIHACVVCRRQRAATATQQMAPLPSCRVTPARPFLSTGVDYCGPFNLRIGPPRSKSTTKVYVAIFVCMVTKAVHIEVVEDLTARAFLDAFTRFISRRGPCRDLYSDNGTAFHGAKRILREELDEFRSVHVQRTLADLGTNWHFISPSAPHQGGLWEAAVKSAKRHMIHVIGGQTLRLFQLQNLMARIEACLNSRPLTVLHDDPSENLALTPGHFLIGQAINAVPEPSQDTPPRDQTKHYLALRHMHQQFWQRWSDEYLTTLSARAKWQRRSPDLRINDVVAIKSDNTPPTHWRLGRIIAVHRGKDELVRNVTVKTADGELTRPIQKLCLILDNNHFESASNSTG